MEPLAIRTRPRVAIHPFHAAVLGGIFPLFLGALLTDYAYWTTYEIQWSNFASWLLIGAMVVTSIALVCAIVTSLRGYNLIYLVVLALTWVVGFFNALHHARDAWAIMPGALVMSVIVSLLALAATVMGFWSLRMGGAR